MSRKLFTAGCVALIATGLVHLLGHYQLTTAAGETEHERQLFAMMRAEPQDMGFGMMRTMFHFLTGFSLTFAVLPIGMGLAGFVVRRHAAIAPGLQSQMAIVYAITWGVMLAIGLVYFFSVPDAFIATVFLLFAASALTAPRSQSLDIPSRA
jgi:hypothetical protein